jgi:hypothetical protein
MQQTPEERLIHLEQNFRFLAAVVSRQSGELQALQAAFNGFLIFAGDNPNIQKQIELELERCVASNLGASTNQDRVDGFDNAANLIRLAMASISEHRIEKANPEGAQPTPG